MRMSEVFESLKRKVADERFSRITHEEWSVWSLKAKGKLPHFIATVELDNGGRVPVDVYHDSLQNAAGTAAMLFQIGLPGIDSKSITGIQIVSEDGSQSRHLTPFRNRIPDAVGAP